MEVTFDDSISDLNWLNVQISGNFERMDVEGCLPLHEYILRPNRGMYPI